jgi:DNA-directed RNA polymerase subunit F
MENDKEYMRFLAACFALVNCGNAKSAVALADELLEELDTDKKVTGGIVDIVPKRRRTKS